MRTASAAAERIRKENSERKRRVSQEKNACDVQGLHGGQGRALQNTYASTRAYAREQFRGNVCHINRDEKESRGKTEGSKKEGQ